MESENLLQLVEGYIIFPTTSYMFRCEKILKTLNRDIVEFRLTTVPREYSSDCGIAISFKSRDFSSLIESISEIECRVEITKK